MPRQQQGIAEPGWNAVCWVHPTEFWVIYQNGSTGRLPADAVFDSSSGEWAWNEPNLAAPSLDNPSGVAMMRGLVFRAGRGGGHLYAIPNEVRAGVFLVELINDATGERSEVGGLPVLASDAHWVRHPPGEVVGSLGRRLRKPHWELVGHLRGQQPIAQLASVVGRLYPEWPPERRGRRW